ncbi:SLC12A1 [Cordylochernes scorpioides]|uniref:SLC12A1 n=1 Tax=Cordylochernes scorpioides TaxID=51811 RepID=A0ABY6KUQ1_9ARAC|nr:SLC12A1 [Cordylochernes scorpioides]
MVVQHGGETRKSSGEEAVTNPAIKFGWVQGVLVRCLLNIWGVILFLRLPWVVGQAGLVLGCLVILLATAVTVLTSLSMSAICTNGVVKGGGTYYMISRSLGPEFGGSIGLIFALANAVAVAMYVVGFAETVVDLMTVSAVHSTLYTVHCSTQYCILTLRWQANGVAILDGGINDIRIVSCLTVVLLLSIAIVGMAWETKVPPVWPHMYNGTAVLSQAQIFLLLILLGAMVTFVVGACLPTTPVKFGKGFVGFDLEVIHANLWSDFRGGENFFSIFAVFFPAATGILAGANISGDLKDPQHAIPRGTLLAIGLTTVSYLSFAAISGSTVVRDATGLSTLDFANMTNCSLAANGTCTYGLMNSFQVGLSAGLDVSQHVFPQVMEMVSAFGPFITAGIFAATLSSALASLVSAPKVFQALCRDKLFPYIHPFGRGYGQNDEPRKGYLVAFVIALLFCGIGQLNHIAPIISNFFLAAYCLINFSTFHASYAKSPVTESVGVVRVPAGVPVLQQVAESGGGAAVSDRDVHHGVVDRAGDLRGRGRALLLHPPPPARYCFTSDIESIMLQSNSSYRSLSITQILPPVSYLIIVSFSDDHQQFNLLNSRLTHYPGSTLASAVSVMVCRRQLGVVQPRPQLPRGAARRHEAQPGARPRQELQVTTPELSRPQLLVLCGPPSARPALVDLAHAITKHSSLLICGHVIPASLSGHHRSQLLQAGYSWLKQRKVKAFYNLIQDDSFSHGVQALVQLAGVGKLQPNVVLLGYKADWQRCQPEELVDYFSVIHGVLDMHLSLAILRLPDSPLDSPEPHRSDSDGLTISETSIAADLRPGQQEVRAGLRAAQVTPVSLQCPPWPDLCPSMASLLNKFRINFSDVIVVPDVVMPPQPARTLPMPRKETCSAPLYQAWLETLTRGLPPMLLVRGNQSSVLTFYS